MDPLHVRTGGRLAPAGVDEPAGGRGQAFPGHVRGLRARVSRHDRLVVEEHDAVVSLVPWQFHPEVARVCLDVGRHMVTSSYVKDEMRALDEEAKSKGIILFNELGVDPGLDHMTAMKVIHRVQG